MRNIKIHNIKYKMRFSQLALSRSMNAPSIPKNSTNISTSSSFECKSCEIMDAIQSFGLGLSKHTSGIE